MPVMLDAIKNIEEMQRKIASELFDKLFADLGSNVMTVNILSDKEFADLVSKQSLLDNPREWVSPGILGLANNSGPLQPPQLPPRPGGAPVPRNPYNAEETARKLKEAQMEADGHARADNLLRARLVGLRSRFDLAQHEMLLCHVYHETVYVFYVFEGGRAGHITDPIDLFPSDELVTQLRILRDA